MYIGYIVFGIAYIFTIGFLFYDIRFEMLRYDTEIAKSKQILRDVTGKDPETNEEYNEQLKAKLAGIKKDDAAEELLYGTAKTLEKADY